MSGLINKNLFPHSRKKGFPDLENLHKQQPIPNINLFAFFLYRGQIINRLRLWTDQYSTVGSTQLIQPCLDVGRSLNRVHTASKRTWNHKERPHPILETIVNYLCPTTRWISVGSSAVQRIFLSNEDLGIRVKWRPPTTCCTTPHSFRLRCNFYGSSCMLQLVM